ncbi:MAG: hypothetical protein AVDCRST_MAG66-1180 [uncultured Pseudonocardia sp.]|uniref:Uncharacterized protein n=1 Tax=uncultured Pseudonocardia sp. TaxID=211455 RepID=A0A6J4NSH3_9PSEU|nr:MAG: hypothetical protein AVDCRST_MAG66-1180 [uncultured Pseudonocardia sp.]
MSEDRRYDLYHRPGQRELALTGLLGRQLNGLVGITGMFHEVPPDTNQRITSQPSVLLVGRSRLDRRPAHRLTPPHPLDITVVETIAAVAVSATSLAQRSPPDIRRPAAGGGPRWVGGTSEDAGTMGGEPGTSQELACRWRCAGF